jgi:hypothetical protein
MIILHTSNRPPHKYRSVMPDETSFTLLAAGLTMLPVGDFKLWVRKTGDFNEFSQRGDLSMGWENAVHCINKKGYEE